MATNIPSRNRMTGFWMLGIAFVFAVLVFTTLNSQVASTALAQPAACTQLADPRDIPAPKIITFDDRKDGEALGLQYESSYGVVFATSTNAPYVHAVGANDPDQPQTSPNVARNAALPGVGKTPFEIDFTFPRSHVGMYLGNGMLPTGGSIIAVVTFMDAKQNILCSFRVPNVSAAHKTFVGAYDTSGSISSVTIDYGQAPLFESIDNLYLAPGLNNTRRPPQPTWTALPTLKPTAGPTATPTPEFPAYSVYAYKSPVLVHPIPIAPDFSITNIEITQGIQCMFGKPASCADDSLSMVLSKSAVARIYIHANNSHSFYNNVPVRLHILAFGKEYTFDAAGKSTASVNQAAHDDAEIYFTVYSGGTANVSFWAEVDPGHIYNSSYTNPRYPGVGSILTHFSNRKTLTVAGERLHYHPTGTDNYAGGWAVNGGAAQWWNQVLPVSDNGINYFVRSGYLDWTSNLSSADAQHSLISTLNLMWIEENALSWWFGTGPFTGVRHVYGWAPASGYSGGHADMPIYPHAGGLGVVGIGSDAAGTNTDNPGSGALIFGHELTHDYNVFHTNTSDACGSNDGNSDFPYTNSSIQAFGFNTLTGKIYDPALTHDLMSYCPSGGSKQGWISPFTWNKMFNDLPAAAVPAQPSSGAAAVAAARMPGVVQTIYSESLVVHATINNPGANPTVTGHLGQMERVVSGLAYPPAAGNYAIEERGAGGGLVYSQTFQVDFTSEYKLKSGGLPPPPFPAGDTASQDISFVMPFADGTRTILLVYNPPQQPQQILDSRAVPQNAPQVTITSPVNNVNWPAHTTQPLTWTGISLDNLPLTYSIFYSNDGGKGWVLLASGLTARNYAVMVDAMAGGSDVRFRVVASDGVNTGFDETPANITIPFHAPDVTIISPASQAIFNPGDLVVLHGGATTMEEGTLPDAVLAWTDNVQGGLGIGPNVAINTLKPGKHTITLTATNQYGVSNSASVTIFVDYMGFLPALQR